VRIRSFLIKIFLSLISYKFLICDIHRQLLWWNIVVGNFRSNQTKLLTIAPLLTSCWWCNKHISTHSPRCSHELALIRIGQYLKGTLEEGMILKPSKFDRLFMDCHVDADFLSLHGKEPRNDPVSVKSRTRLIISINHCPIVWSSKLQDSIALSTMMAEYYALSTAMRDVLPLRNLTMTVAKAGGIPDEHLSTFKVTCWEHNTAAETLANLDSGQTLPGLSSMMSRSIGSGLISLRTFRSRGLTPRNSLLTSSPSHFLKSRFNVSERRSSAGESLSRTFVDLLHILVCFVSFWLRCTARSLLMCGHADQDSNLWPLCFVWFGYAILCYFNQPTLQLRGSVNQGDSVHLQTHMMLVVNAVF